MLAEVLLIFVLPSPPHDILESSGASQVEDIDLLSQERFSLLKDNFWASQSWRICSSEAWLPTSSAFRFPSSPGRCAAVNLKEICFCQGMPLTSIGKGKWERGDAKWWFSSFFLLSSWTYPDSNSNQSISSLQRSWNSFLLNVMRSLMNYTKWSSSRVVLMIQWWDEFIVYCRRRLIENNTCSPTDASSGKVSSPLDALCIDIWISVMIIRSQKPDDKEIGYSNVLLQGRPQTNN